MERGENIMKIKKLNMEPKQCRIVTLAKCSCSCGGDSHRLGQLKAAQIKAVR